MCADYVTEKYFNILKYNPTASVEMLGRKGGKVILFTDSKSLFDAVNTSNLMLDKRLRVDIAALRELSDNREVTVKWIVSSRQLADVMTKKGASKSYLLQVLQSGSFLE